MKKRVRYIMLAVVLGVALAAVGLALAYNVNTGGGDMSEMFRKNVSKTPSTETEKAALYMMDFYVPAQNTKGELVTLQYTYTHTTEDDPLTEGDDTIGLPIPEFDERSYAKPLVSVYIDDMEHEEELGDVASINGGITFGEFDAYVAISLDDGSSWKTTNLSRSADLSSFVLKTTGEAYPGDVHNVQVQVAEDKILVVWASKYCEGGSPLYSLAFDTDATTGEAVIENPNYFTELEEIYGKDAMYLYDLFGVAGSQKSVNYEEQGWPEIGEIPYSCIWVERGKLIAGDDPSTVAEDSDGDGVQEGVETTYVLWSKPERLTSGKRDANLPAVDCAKGAGCMLTWQEDPEGLRPGQGLGPGEGWSGAIANAKTDIWYSYISFNDFDVVYDDDDTLLDIGDMVTYTMETYAAEMAIVNADSDTTNDLGMPKAYVPMAMPVRLTDNNMCKWKSPTTLDPTDPLYDDKVSDPYCYIDFDSIDDITQDNVQTLLTLSSPEADADYCAEYVSWVTPGGQALEICKTADGRVMNGRVAATRVRLTLKPYSPAGAANTDGDPWIDDGSAWVSMAYEETKALGDVLIGGTDADIESCTAEEEAAGECDPIDIGKDVWYHSFDMFEHDFVDQGGILNQPAVCKNELDPFCSGGVGVFYDLQTYNLITRASDGTDVAEPIGDYYLTEIARRFALTTNSIKAAMESGSKLSAMLIYKQGIINQGGPADIFLRRVVLPDVFDPAVDNPYAYANMECADWEYTDGSNPMYLQGICLSPAINISGSTIVQCDPGYGGGEIYNDSELCASTFPVADDGSIPDDDRNDDGTTDSFPKVIEWRQLPYLASATTETEYFTIDESDLDDQSWENPFDVAKGHRGFLDGDIVMMMYAWAPNWKANTVGNDHYNLYIRRSFDGGLTWTTTPATSGGIGIEVPEFYYYGDDGDPETDPSIGQVETITFTYAAGAAEQGRNVSQLIGNKETILDPRYTPSGGLKQYPIIDTSWLTTYLSDLTIVDTLPYTSDAARDKSRFFVIYETGDNTTVAEGEATPLDLFFSLGYGYGDYYEWIDYVKENTDGTTTITKGWDWLENAKDDLSGEASVVTDPGARVQYVVWNQWKETIDEETGEEHIFDADMIYRRTWHYLYDSATFTPIDPIEVAVASIIYVSDNDVAAGTDQLITLIGTVRGDEPVEFLWTSDIDGELGDTQVLTINAKDMKPGWHQMTFQARCAGGKWTNSAQTTVFIGYKTFMPTVKR